MSLVRFRALSGAVVLAATAFLPMAASAGSAASTVAVSATVSQNCTINTGTVAFGSYDPVTANASSDATVTGSLSVACTKNASAVTISLDYGAHASSTQRRMVGTSHGDFLLYNLYQDSGHTTAWDNASNKYALAAPSSKASQSINIYGVITLGQDISVDSYTDTVNSTINF